MNYLYILIIIVCAGLLIFWAIKGTIWFIIAISNLRLKLHENKIAKEKMNAEAQKQINNLTYVYPDQKGILPVPRHVLEDPDTINWNKRRYSEIFGGSINHTSTTHQGTIADVAPDFFSLWQNDKLPQDKFLLGYDVKTNEPIIVSFKDLYSSIVGGLPRSGKSTFVRLILIQAILQNSKFAIIDPHANAGEDSLAGSFYAVEDMLLYPVARTIEAQITTITNMYNLVKARINGEQPANQDIVLVIDEIGEVLSNTNTHKPLVDLLNLIVNQAGKIRVYVIAIGQNFHSNNIATTIRNSFISVFTTQSKKEVAKLLSNHPDFGEIAENIQVGQVVWSGRSGLKIINVPNITSRQVDLIAQSMRKGKRPKEITASYSVGPVSGEISGDEGEISGKSISTFESSGLDQKRLLEIKRRVKLLESNTKIITEVWGVPSSGNDFQKAAREYRRYMAALVGE